MISTMNFVLMTMLAVCVASPLVEEPVATCSNHYSTKAQWFAKAKQSISLSDQLNLVREFAGDLQALNATVRDDISTQFPSLVGLTEGFSYTLLMAFVAIFHQFLLTIKSPSVEPPAILAPSAAPEAFFL